MPEHWIFGGEDNTSDGLAEQAALRQRVRDRMEEEGIPVGTDDPLLLALGATPLPTEGNDDE